jgi:hypothetical protein
VRDVTSRFPQPKSVCITTHTPKNPVESNLGSAILVPFIRLFAFGSIRIEQDVTGGLTV